MKNIALKVIGLTALAASLTGCIGSNAVTSKVMKFNVEVVDNRYARAGVNFLLAPVYGITTAADYVLFNSLEFWTGSNPLNGNPHIFDSKVDTKYKINDDLAPSLTDAPIDELSNRTIQTGEMHKIDDNTIQMDIVYNNGDTATLTGVKSGEQVSYYMDGELVSQTTISELEAASSAQS
ncbi:multidrug ABC transporter ATPase [Vibrio sp. qd031]|uniref:DUF3332 domain-containing protein n=1 Tax=Vibrio sp. qd031 TaxID=1603038 RepID=UPI000A11F1FF|nr:DUF3332 domain-containing protein [Vibrio sp. qd031]ORT52743.1 multidrug ABC transporter ATPase [Vibrio sp. qd031]